MNIFINEYMCVCMYFMNMEVPVYKYIKKERKKGSLRKAELYSL